MIVKRSLRFRGLQQCCDRGHGEADSDVMYTIDMIVTEMFWAFDGKKTDVGCRTALAAAVRGKAKRGTECLRKRDDQTGQFWPGLPRIA